MAHLRPPIPFIACLLLLTGCASIDKHPQTQEEFVSMMKGGGLFTNKEQLVIKRPVKAVVADAREFASACLAVSVSRKLPREAASSTQYRPTIAPQPGGVTALSVQELYNGRPSRGAPPGGLFSFVAEMRAAGAGVTQIDAYYITARGKMLSGLKSWLEGQKQRCPALD